jgi:hypothetical protein
MRESAMSKSHTATASSSQRWLSVFCSLVLTRRYKATRLVMVVASSVPTMGPPRYAQTSSFLQ